ncbi:zinc finger protein 804B isoform 2-T2 [Leptodactylus fuscus]|uniref:zinc finger protein 804B isoform X2 n=1 Tax=Leptodactylus fuscus TaxID=238119 RepID=UPI003F4ED411
MTKGYAEKGKSIANALEDLKANFYCELCDKQYHKHQEFDNHINSYDHAHKQRLKELKHREFARNVASKSWKDEKKQEKALKRLHQLAELRKQPDCVAEEVPLFKAPRLKGPQEDLGTGKDDNIANVRCEVLCSPEAVTSSSSSGSTEDKKPDTLFDGEVLKDGSCCFVGNQNQIQVPLSNSSSANNRAGVSFCFSKKALLKLDSSASVFNESLDEVNEYNQFLHHKAKQMSVSFRHYAHLNESAAETSVLSQPDETDMSLPDNTPANAEKLKDDKGSQENSKEQSEVVQSNITAKMHPPDTSCTDQPSQKEVNVPSETEPTSETTTEASCQMQSSEQETCSSKHSVADAILIEHFSNLLSQKHAEDSCKSKEENCEASNDLQENPSECPVPEHSLGESVNTNTHAKALSFLSVLSKDGNTILQWPTELVLFTKTQPSISYACNPLYFDFKCSPKNKMRKPNEGENGRSNDNDQRSRSYEDKTSGINGERTVGSGMESPSLEPKSFTNLEDLADKDMDRPMMEFTHKAKKTNGNDSDPQLSTYSNHSRKCFRRDSYHSRKRKRSSHGQSDHCMVKENRHCKEKYKRRRYSHQDGLLKNKSYSSKRSLASRQEDILSGENSDGWKESDSDTNSDISHKTSSSRWSYSSSSISTGSSCRYKDLLSKASSHEASTKEGNVRSAKHKDDISSESDYFNDDKKVNCKCKRHKHNTFSEVSKNEYLEHWLCSKHARNKHRSWKKQNDLHPDGEKFNSRQGDDTEIFEIVESRVENPSASLEEKIDLPSPSRSPINIERSESCATKDFLHCQPQEVAPILVNCRENSSKNIVEPEEDNEQEQLDSDLHLDGKSASTQTVGDNNRTKDLEVNFCGPLESSSLECDKVGFEKVETPLHDEAKCSSNNLDLCSKNDISRPHNGSEGCDVTVVANCDNLVLDDVIHIDTETRTEIEERNGQFISEEQPIMQCPDPVHLNLTCPLPSLRHPGGIDSPETKEEPLRLGRPDVNTKPGLVDGNLKCFYDSTMQDFRKMDNRLHHKSSGPPLAQQPVTFSPDEVDKYKILQMQAQQHMQKQLLTKHFKALPTNGSAVFSTAQTIQPVSIQHHPSITTIHHALMQRYAVTASMHSHVNHFPLPHLNPFPQSQFPPISLPSSLTPTLFPTPPPIIGHALAHPLHLVSTAAIHPPHLTIQAIPHATLIPAIFAPHPNTGMHPTLQLHPLIHPLFQGQEFHHHSGSGHLH